MKSMSHRWNRRLSQRLAAIEDSSDRIRGLFVTGTDTGVGKTVLACAIAATLADRGERVAVFKPVVTGLDEPGGLADHELLRASARSPQELSEIAPYRFGPPVSPHLAAELAGVRIAPEAIIEAARTAAAEADVLVVEGVGGLLVPLTDTYLVRDLAVALGFPLVVAARPGLGTINQSLLTIEAARQAGLTLASIVLTPWPGEPGEMQRSNRNAIASLGEVEVATLGPLYTGPPINGVGDLPVDAWLSAPSSPAPVQVAATR
jgi:dethiobiotin synthetase